MVSARRSAALLLGGAEDGQRSYLPVVISDCVASTRGEDAHRMALELTSRSFAWVLTVEEFRTKVLAGAPLGRTWRTYTRKSARRRSRSLTPARREVPPVSRNR